MGEREKKTKCGAVSAARVIGVKTIAKLQIGRRLRLGTQKTITASELQEAIYRILLTSKQLATYCRIVMEQVEEFVNKVVKSFEEKPISTTIKGVIILWVLKEVIKWFKN